jgi:hypothetical protein
MSEPNGDRAAELAYRRMQLRAHCEQQRRQLGERSLEVEGELGGIDRTVTVVRSVLSAPALVAAGVAALTLIGPRRAVRWITRGTFWYATGKQLLGAFVALRATRESEGRKRIADSG